MPWNGPPVATRLEVGIRRIRLAKCAVAKHEDERVELRVERGNPRQSILRQRA